MRRSLSDRLLPSGATALSRGLVLLLVLVAALPAPVQGQEEVSAQECCLGFLFPLTARSVALGRAISARAGPEAVFANPAGLAAMDTARIMIHHTTILEADQANAISVLLAPRRVGVFGVSYVLLDQGDQISTDEFGQEIGTLTTIEHFLVATYATAVLPGLTAGINYKLYQFRGDCTGACSGGGVGTTHLVDAGVQYHPSGLPTVQLGVSVTDLGFPLQVENEPQSDPTPTRLHLSGAIDALRMTRSDSTLALWISAEADLPVQGLSTTEGGVGAELAFREAVFIRAGYRTGEGVGTGLAVGFAIEYERFSVGVGKSFYQSALSGENSPVQVTFGLDF